MAIESKLGPPVRQEAGSLLPADTTVSTPVEQYRPPAAAAVRYVEVETSRYCNRTCSWCPNGQTRARRVQELMPWGLFAKIVDELASWPYEGWLAFHNFNEPMANPRLGREVAHVRSRLPAAKPSVYTNGDRLSPGALSGLLEAGVRYVRVTRYPARADIEPALGPLVGWLRRTGLAGAYPWVLHRVRQGLAARWEDATGAAVVEVIAPDVATYNDRGGTARVPVIGTARQEPCLMTATSVSIDYRGRFKMCCNVVPDVVDHHRYVVGTVADTPIADLWASRQMAEWRRCHAAADWSASPACRGCAQSLPETRR